MGTMVSSSEFMPIDALKDTFATAALFAATVISIEDPEEIVSPALPGRVIVIAFALSLVMVSVTV